MMPQFPSMSRKPKRESRNKAPSEQTGAPGAEPAAIPAEPVAESVRAALEERPSKLAKNERWKVVGICVILAALVWAVFGQTLRHEFVNFDDGENVCETPAITGGLTLHGLGWAFTHTQAGRWAPLAAASHMLDCQLYGLRAGGHLLTNLLLHATSAILLFLLFRQMTGALWRSAFVAGCFAIHPLKVEAVAWVSGRGDLLSGIFFMLALWAYARYARCPEPRRSVAWVALWLALGLMGKAMLMTVPFVLLLLDYWPLGRFQNRSQLPGLIREKWPLFALSAFSCAASLVAQNAVFDPTMERFALPLRMGNALVAYCVYLVQMIYPADLAVYYPFLVDGWPPWEVMGAILLLGGLTAGVLVLRRKQPFLVVGWLWYLGMLVPVIGILQIGGQAHADRYTYLPQIGVYVGVTWAVADWSKGWRYRRWIWGGLSAGVILALLVSARIQTSYWRNSELLWTHALACTNRNSLAHNNLGLALLRGGRAEEAIAHYREALRINPAFSEAHNNLGVALRQKGQSDEAIAHYREALRINPAYSEAHNNLGNALLQRGQTEEAIAQYREALRINPANSEAHNNLGNALLQRGQAEEAVAQYREALRINPADSEAHYNLGNALIQTGQVEESMAQYREVLRINPTNLEAHNNLGNALLQRGQTEEAIAQFRETLRINPSFSEAYYNLGNVLLQRGRAEEAIAQYREALRINPAYLEAMNNLASSLATAGDGRLRNGREALEIAQRAHGLTKGGNPIVLGTLAAAYAETGRFGEAEETARRAIELAKAQGNPALAGTLQEYLKLYQARRPLRTGPGF